MVFSADDRVLVKVLRQEKRYGAKNSSQNFPASQIWGKLQEHVYRSRIHDVDQLKSSLIKELEHFHQVKRSGSGVHVFQFAFEHTEGILNTYFSYVWCLYRRTLRQSYVCAVAYSGHFCFGGDLTKPSITIARVDRFYLNLVICLQLDTALLIQNSVKIWHCLAELWKCIQGLLFSWTQCIWCNSATKKCNTVYQM